MSKLAKVDLASLKSKVNKLVIGKLETNPVDFKKMSDVADKELLKKMCMMNWFQKLMLFRLLILVI